MKKFYVKIILSTFLLVGCATIGNEFDISAVSGFVPGETTYSEAVQMLGNNPIGSKQNEDGSMVYRWAWSHANLAGAGADRVDLLFDSNGKFIRELSRSSL